MDEKSLKYLKEIVEDSSKNSYRDACIFSDILGSTYYLLARDEPEKNKKHELMMRSLAYHELCSLDHRNYTNSSNVVEYALAMIEIGRMLNDDMPYDYKYRNDAPFEKAIYILKHQLIDLEWQEIQKLEPEQKQCNLDYIKYQISVVEQRLVQLAPPEFQGQIERYIESL